MGTLRSETTFLQQVLNAYSQIAIAPETNFIRTYAETLHIARANTICPTDGGLKVNLLKSCL
ncbi:hypothetical protein [Okeania sp. SIO3B5]|uniref:hypothetical protein n=1 Tax=Okeania sp. SIO3B5 TaxID=2607811 RepID=UPI0025E040EC|nr:hypothetical protein [Okeania sp. SIO3B5]